MSAVVLSLREIFSHNKSYDWTNQERANLTRVMETLERAGFRAELEVGLSDESDPWAVFCRSDTGDVIVHIARIDDVYVFDSAVLNIILRGDNFNDIIEQFLQTRSIVLPHASRPNSQQISLHPAATLSAIILTAFLVADELEGLNALSTQTGINTNSEMGVEEDTSFLRQLADVFLEKTHLDKSDDTHTTHHTHISLLAAAFVFVSTYLSEGADVFSELSEKITALAALQSAKDISNDNGADTLFGEIHAHLDARADSETFYQNAHLKQTEQHMPQDTSTPETMQLVPPLNKDAQEELTLEAQPSFVTYTSLPETAYVEHSIRDLFAQAPSTIVPKDPTPEGVMITVDAEETVEMGVQLSYSTYNSIESNEKFLEDIAAILHINTMRHNSLFFETGAPSKEYLISAFMDTSDNVHVFSFNGRIIVYDQDAVADMQSDNRLLDTVVRETTIEGEKITFIGVLEEVDAAFHTAFT